MSFKYELNCSKKNQVAILMLNKELTIIQIMPYLICGLSCGQLHLAPHFLKNFFEIIPIIGTFMKRNFMARNTSILLGEHFEDFISTKVTSGRYNSASEVIRTALRLLEAEELKTKSLNKALLQGEKSGFTKDFDPKAHLKKLHSKFL